MDEVFDQAGARVSDLYDKHDAQGFLQLWTKCFEDSILQYTNTPKQLHKKYKGRDQVNIKQQVMPRSGKHCFKNERTLAESKKWEIF